MLREFVSFPKSGRTWIRYALTLAGASEQIHFHHDGFEYNDGDRPPLDFDYEARLARSSRVDRLIYLSRDPRDQIISLFHQVTGRFKDIFDYREGLSEFIRDPYFGAENLAEFHRQWTRIANSRNMLRVTYEACHADFAGTLQAILDYYELPPPERSLSSIARDASFAEMKKLEESGAFDQPWLRTRNGAAKVRSGKVGGFRTELSAADLSYLNEVFQRPD